MTVNTMVDELDGSIVDGDVSLRDAIEVANATPGTDTINFDPAIAGQTLTLTMGELSISDSVTVQGLGANKLTINADGQSRIFTVDDGVGARSDFELSGLTLTGGETPTSGSYIDITGGAIFSKENLTVRESVITGNSAFNGGAIRASGVVLIDDSTISDNFARSSGGGVVSYSTLTINNSTLSGNQAVRNGGGVYVLSQTTINHSTITGNVADADSDGTGVGGGLAMQATSTRTLNLNHTIVAQNVHPTSPDLYQGTGTVNPQFTLVGDRTASALTAAPVGSPDGSGNLIGDPLGAGVIDPELGPLANNGGTTPTHALLTGSPAINAGDANFSSPPASDQRGAPFTRQHVVVDMGAFEQQTFDLVVDTADDPASVNFGMGGLSLREAVQLTNQNPGADSISFSGDLNGQTVTLNHGEIVVSDELMIDGPGADQLTLSGNSLSQIFHVNDEDSGTQLDVEISGLTLTDGLTPGGSIPFRGGGAIFTREALTVRDSIVTGNSSTWAGGAIATYLSPVQVINSTISHNDASFDAGGVYGFGPVSFINSTVSHNTAGRNGGGIWSINGTVTIEHSTVTANTSDANSSGDGAGGGVFVWPGRGLELHHSIVAGNTDNTLAAPDISFQGSPGSVSYSLVGDNDGSGLAEAPVGAPDASGNLIGGAMQGPIDPLLGALQDNGGTTPTHALLTGSPAINAGDPTATAGLNDVPEFDQRGNPFGRVVGPIDMGALEVQQQVVDGDFDNDGDLDGDDIDLLIANIAEGPADPGTFDMNGDGEVDLDDRDEWLTEAGALNLPSGNAYLLGDANLDGFVDGQDFIAWNSNKFSPTAAWTAGDFNADGTVDGQDFIIWNANKFQSANLVAPGHESISAWAELENHEERRAQRHHRQDLIDAVFAWR